MVISNKELTVNVISSQELVPSNKTPIIFLHGFTGRAEDWSFIASSLPGNYYPIAIDLPGHGKTKVSSYSVDAYIACIELVFAHFNISKAVVVGYSMGGRTALAYTIKNPNKVISLVLEGATAGIEDEAEKKERAKSDSELADLILKNGLDWFVSYWLSMPFFKTLKRLGETEYAKLVEQKKKNSANGLANSLKEFSTGKMPSLWNKLHTINIPTLLIAGSFDTKFVEANKTMNQLIPNSQREIVDDCGHNTHLENPQNFITLVNKFLINLENHET